MPGLEGERADVLFLSHAAVEIGPPMMLLSLQRWLQRNRDLRFATVSTVGGPLLPRFEALGPTTVLRGPWSPHLVAKAALERSGRPALGRRVAVLAARERLRRVLPSAPPRLVYVNALAPANVLALRAVLERHPGVPVLLHVHELSIVLEHDLVPSELAFALGTADHIVAASCAVRTHLVDRHGVSPDRITVVRSMIDAPPAPRQLAGPAAAVRDELDLGPDDPLVVACGSLDWRKAPDLFLRLAWEQRRRRPDLQATWAWVGSDRTGALSSYLQFELERLGLEGRVHVVGVREDPLPWFVAADVFVLPSREDPFPLVCVEAAAVGTPVVCFDNGGIVELVEPNDAGTVVPYPDVVAMADAVCDLLDDPERAQTLGANGAEAVHQHHLTDHLAPRLAAVVAAHAAP